jgi:hypothetical protein
MLMTYALLETKKWCEESIQISMQYVVINIIQYKGKAVPVQTRTGPEGSRRLRLPDFKTVGT